MEGNEPNKITPTPTRQTLLIRLKDWDDNDSWREFFDRYWKLIYSVSLRSGLSEQGAQDVVQETMLSVAKQMPDFRYDSKIGSFKSWLLRITYRRIADHFRMQRPGDAANSGSRASDPSETPLIERIPDDAEQQVQTVWDEEWEKNLMGLALERVKRRVDPRHYQIFDLYSLKHWPPDRIAITLHVSRTLIYVTKHRIIRMIRKEVKRLEQNLDRSDPSW